MIEIKNYRIVLAAVNTRMAHEISNKKFPVSLGIYEPIRVAPQIVFLRVSSIVTLRVIPLARFAIRSQSTELLVFPGEIRIRHMFATCWTTLHSVIIGYVNAISLALLSVTIWQ